ncbi:polyprenyl synthetase family protein [Singulisphaera sp. PoT]|uniref:polyprenyl synthetase family protein n=1 Tax=Singulisphaera sp. PoT TaxID=3411797 RepID=UPI003BF4D861
MSSRSLLKAEETSRKLAAIYAPIAAELAESERIFAEELGSHYPFVQQLVDHCSDFQGKRIRPALVLLTAQACGSVQPAHPVLAAVVEMIHTATLVHDDILDEAMIRRHAATVNAEWGNETAVLLGDYLFTHAFHLAASLETTLACRWIGHATNLVCEGEMQQIHNRGNLVLDEDTYYSIVRGKTAELTAVSCRLGAHYAGASQSRVDDMEEYGRDLGIAFQIADDVLDLWGEERTTGKSLGTDLEKQKLTLPLIRLLNTVEPSAADKIRQMLAEPEPDRSLLRSYLDGSDALEYSWDRARYFAAQACSRLDDLPESPAKTVLKTLTQYVVRRAS